MEFGTHGVSDSAVGTASSPTDETDQFAGMGPWLESDDATVFQTADALIRRQELLAINRWNIDQYYKTVVDGYPWATLQHDTTRDLYTFSLPYGVSQLSIQPIPNKNLDLVNKTSEQLLVDFPEADAEPIDDSEEAQNAAEMANRFLAQDGSEQGTNDPVLFDDRVKLALATASTYVEYWVDPTGGGYVPLQIKAHPQATDVSNPLVGPDGQPTTDYILRYVTPDQQFTDDPTKAAPQWQKKLRASKWAREHLRTFPESVPIEDAEKAIVLGYCTLGEGKLRWPALAEMDPETLSTLCDWTPTRYLVLLPPYQRARWQLTDGKEKNKGGSSDERIMFYYHIYQRATPDSPKGADVVVSGIQGGLILDKRLLSTDVEVKKAQGTVKETRCREIPIVQITPRGDPTGQDPTGRCYMNLFVGATEANAVLGQGFAELIQRTIHTPYATSALSPIESQDVVDAAGNTRRFLTFVRKDDLPQQLNPPVIPNAFFEMYNISDEAINSIANAERAATGDINTARERSGKAIQLAVGQNNIGQNSRLTRVNNAYARACRIKLELAMSEFTTTQQIAYIGEDGANKAMDLHAVDFALIGKVSIKSGTGTGLSQDNKVQYLGNLKAEGFVSPEDAADAARPSFTKRLGLPANTAEQYISRCLDAWSDGPPESDPTDPSQIDPATGQPTPDWKTQYRAWMQAQQAYTAAQSQFTQQQQAYQTYWANRAIVAGGPPSGAVGPEGQVEKASGDYQTAVIAVQLAEQQNPQIAMPPQAPQPPQVPKPWTPFTPRACDTELPVAMAWQRQTKRLMMSVDFEKFGPEWADVLERQYTTARQAVTLGQTAQAAPHGPHGPAPQPSGPSTPTAPTPPTAPSSSTPRAA